MNEKKPKIIITMYIFLFLLILGVLLTYALPHKFMVYYFPFGILNKTIFDTVILILLFLIFLRANKLYSKTGNKKMAIIGGGFLAGSLLQMEELIHLFSFILDRPIVHNAQIFHFFFGQLILGVTLFFSVFYTQKKSDTNNFRRNIYSAFIAFAVVIFLLDKVLSTYLFDFIYKILPNITLVRVIEQAFYLMAAFIYTDARIVNNKNPLSKFNLGLLILGISPLLILAGYSTTLYAFMFSLSKIAGFSLIFLGLKEFGHWSVNLNFRQKLSAYLSLFLTISFIIFIPFTSLLFNIQFPVFSSYLFLGFFIVANIVQYIVATNFSEPILNIIQAVDKYKPETEPEEIKVLSADEIGVLTQKLNKILELVWKYTQDLIEKQNLIFQAGKKERLLREVIEASRSTLNINETLDIVCEELSKLIGVERVSVIELGTEQSNKTWTIKKEYKKAENIKGISNFTQKDVVEDLWAEKFANTDDYIAFDDIESSEIPESFKDTFRELGVKSIIGLPIIHESERWGVVFLSKYYEVRHWTKEDLDFIRTVADQLGIAIYQAKLFNTSEQTAKRERLLRQVAEIISSAESYEETEQKIVECIGKAYNADRCFFRYYNKPDKEFLPAKFEYRSSEDVASIKEVPVDSEGLQYFADRVQKGKKIFIIKDVSNYIQKNNLQGSAVEGYLKGIGIKSDYPFPMWDKKNEITWFVLHYTKKAVNLSDEDIDTLSAVANQIKVAIDQVILYEETKQTAQKESILREIISEIKLSSSIDQAYNYILTKLAEIFNVDRAIFIELDASKYEEPKVRYEHSKITTLKSLKNKPLPGFCKANFYKATEDLSPKQNSKMQSYYQNVSEELDFLKEYSIDSVMMLPLVHYDQEVRIFGVIALCSSLDREWTDFELELLESINDSVITVVWEITKNIEISKLRDTFVATLAHDLQVPLLGESKAIEYLLSRPEEYKIVESKDIILGIKENNEILIYQLTKLLDAYYYELGKKELKFKKCNIGPLLIELVDEQREKAQEKNIDISMEISENIPEIAIDRAEIRKVFNAILDNAITYTQNDGSVKIKLSQTEDRVVTCINDNGPGISPKKKEMIFERYATAMEIERKVGSGLSLYLSKLIVNAHGGELYFTTEIDKGTTFCVLLPKQIY